MQGEKTCPENSVLGDLDSDGDVDLFTKDLGGGYKAILNDGAGNFTTHWQMEESTVLYGIWRWVILMLMAIWTS